MRNLDRNHRCNWNQEKDVNDLDYKYSTRYIQSYWVLDGHEVVHERRLAFRLGDWATASCDHAWFVGFGGIGLGVLEVGGIISLYISSGFSIRHISLTFKQKLWFHQNLLIVPIILSIAHLRKEECINA